jgi:uncharacterized membrane protein YfcA
MAIDFTLTLAGAFVGLMVGITGMGGGALLTPILVLVFGIPPLTAISSDLVTSLVMKPVGGFVHFRKGSVNFTLVKWLTVGSVPAAFLGSAIIGHIGHSTHVQTNLKIALGVALIASFSASIAKAVIDRRSPRTRHDEHFVVHPGRTILIGVIGGIAVGMTSVGAGSLVIAMLLLAYPRMRPAQLVGTDIVQAIPLVASAAVGHLIFGEVHFAVTTSLLIGALPAVWIGAHISAKAPAAVVRPVIAAVLLSSAFALLKAPNWSLVPAALVGGGLTWYLGFFRRRAVTAGEPVEHELTPASNPS